MKFTTPPPEGIVQWYRAGVPGGGQKDHIFDRVRAKLSGGQAYDGTRYFKLHSKQLSTKDLDTIIANMKQDEAGYPTFQTGSTSGIDETRYQEWLIERYLPVKSSTEGFTDTTISNEDKKEVVEEEAKDVVEEAEEEVKENIEEAAEVVDEALEDAPIEEPEVAKEEAPDLSDIVDLLPPGMLAAVNQQTGQNYEKTPKTSKSSSSGSISNKKMLSTLVSSLDAIAGTLSSINVELKKQNTMLGEALGSTVTNLQEIETSHEGLNQKFDAILAAFQAQTAAAEQAIDDAETARDIAARQAQSDVADTIGIPDPNDKDKKGGGGGKSNYFGRIARWMWKKFAPKWMRSRLRLLRMKFGPKNIVRRAGNFLNTQKERAARFLGNTKDRIAGAVKRTTTAVSTKVDDTVKATKRFGGEALEGVARFGQRFGDDAVRYGKRGLAFVKNSPVAKRIAIASTKYGGRMVPVAGTAISAADAADRAMRGDTVGAWLAGLGGTAGLVTTATSGAALTGAGAAVPAVAEAVSIAADTGLFMCDIFNAITGREFTAEDQKAVDESLPQKETGGLTKPGLAMLHGTEAIVDKDYSPTKMLSPIGGALIGAASNFLTQAGPAAALVAPMFKQVAGSLTNVFDVPATLAQTNVGGSFAGIDSALKESKKKAKDKGDIFEEETIDLSDAEKKQLDEADSNTGNFFSGLARFFGITPRGPDGTPVPPAAPTDANLPSTGVVRDRPWNTGIKLTTLTTQSGKSFQVASIVANQFKGFITDLEATGYKIDVIGGWRPAGTGGGTGPADADYDKNRYAHPYGASIDINPTKNPYGKALVTDMPDNIGEIAAKHGLGWGGAWSSVKDAMHFSAMKREGGNRDFDIFDKPGPAFRYGGDVGLNGQEQITVGEEGPEIVMKNLVYEHKPIYEMLSAFNAATTPDQLVSAVERHAPEILMYDEEGDDMGDEPIIIIQQAPSPPPIIVGGPTILPKKKSNASKTLLMQKLQG